ncbi:hypothetical protein F2981_10340 [Sinorhizobium meliloti]|nr:hypothetical protein [Sinorhizobium meliloti]
MLWRLSTRFSRRSGQCLRRSRPAGHHAEKNRGHGLLLFQQCSDRARHAQTAHGAERVAIVDWGRPPRQRHTGHFLDDPSVLFCSTHQIPLYPVPVPRTRRASGTMSSMRRFRPIAAASISAMPSVRRVLPRLENFRPDFF